MKISYENQLGKSARKISYENQLGKSAMKISYENQLGKMKLLKIKKMNFQNSCQSPHFSSQFFQVFLITLSRLIFT
jgi:hypothetical protein